MHLPFTRTSVSCFVPLMYRAKCDVELDYFEYINAKINNLKIKLMKNKLNCIIEQREKFCGFDHGDLFK